MRRIKSSSEERIKALRENRYLLGLESQILDYLVQHTQLTSFESGECILREGEPGQGLYIVQSGRVKIFKHSPTGREMIISVLESGDSFNEVPVFDQKENPANVGAVLDTKLWVIDALVLRTVIADHPEASQQIIINLSHNLRMLVGKVAELSFYTVTTRLAHLLLKLPESQLADGGPSRLTQDDLAARIGTVREVVARSLKELETTGAIEIERGKIRIIDREKLIILG